MKKTYVIALAALTFFGNVYARQWNFSKWSDATVTQVQGSSDWTNDEKGDGSTNVVPNNACMWNVGSSVSAQCDANGQLMANGSVISELEGLKWTNLAAKKIAIAFDYQTTTDANKWGPYYGASYLWLNGKTTAVHFTIPSVAPGTVITMGVESHKPSDARGVDLLVGGVTVDKDPAAYPTAYEVYTWTVPGEAGGDPVDVDVQPNNGCHIYYITVDEGDIEIDNSTISVAYLYDSTYGNNSGYGYLTNGGLDSDPIWSAVTSFDAKPVDLSSSQTLSTTELNDSLKNFDVVVLSEAVSSKNAYAIALKDIINMVPMLNLKAYMYKNWGFGSGVNPSPKATSVTFAEDYWESDLLANLETLDEGAVTLFDCEDVTALAGGNLVQGVTITEGTLFAEDVVMATVGEGTCAVHAHGDRNQYMLIPISSDNVTLASGDAGVLVNNAIPVLAKTKSTVRNAATPVIASEYANLSTTVSISCTTDGATIYYTTDGTDPTTASAVYSEPFVVTTDSLVVKAFAVAHGYYDSEIATAAISVQSQAAAPSLSVAYSEGYSTITMSAAEGVSVYYSFNGIEAVDDAALYTEPVVITEPATVYAFAAADGVLQSEMATREVVVSGIPAVKDTVAHFTANETDWFTNVTIYDYNMAAQEVHTSNYAAKAAYYWGKSAWAYYSTTEVDSTYTVKDMNGADSTVYVYKADPAAMKYVYSSSDTQWRLASQGQLFTGETNVSPSYAIGNARSAYYAATAQDLIGEPSKGKMTFGGKGSGEPYSAKIESVVKFQAPFDVVSYVTNGGGKDFYLEIQVSADGENWTCLDSVKIANTQRYYAKTRLHYAGTDEVYVRMAQVGGSTKAQVYDIYVITTDGTTGIEAVESNDVKVADERIYDLMGRRVNAMTPGSIYLKNGKKVMVR